MPKSNFEVLAYEPSPLGFVCLRRRELLSEPGTIVTEITLDHELLMTSYHTASEQALATQALERHAGEGLRVLVGGLGLGYTAHEVLKSDRVAEVEVVEFLPPVVEWLREGQIPLADALNGEARLSVSLGDVYGLLDAEPTRHFDLILIDVDHSPDENLATGNQPFYTEAGLRRAKRHLAPGGWLCVWSYAAHSPFADALRASFARVELETVRFENRLIGEFETDHLFLASDG